MTELAGEGTTELGFVLDGTGGLEGRAMKLAGGVWKPEE